MRQHEEPNQIRPGMTIREEHYRGRHQLERPHNYHRRDVFIMAVIVNGKKVAGLGQPGKDGAPGKSAYQAAKEKGYTGTEYCKKNQYYTHVYYHLPSEYSLLWFSFDTEHYSTSNLYPTPHTVFTFHGSF